MLAELQDDVVPSFAVTRTVQVPHVRHVSAEVVTIPCLVNTSAIAEGEEVLLYVPLEYISEKKFIE